MCRTIFFGESVSGSAFWGKGGDFFVTWMMQSGLTEARTLGFVYSLGFIVMGLAKEGLPEPDLCLLDPCI